MSNFKGNKRGPYKRVQDKKNVEMSEDGMSYQEIARVLGISVLEVKKIERRALQKLQAPGGQNGKLHKYWDKGCE